MKKLFPLILIVSFLIAGTALAGPGLNEVHGLNWIGHHTEDDLYPIKIELGFNPRQNASVTVYISGLDMTGATCTGIAGEELDVTDNADSTFTFTSPGIGKIGRHVSCPDRPVLATHLGLSKVGVYQAPTDVEATVEYDWCCYSFQGPSTNNAYASLSTDGNSFPLVVSSGRVNVFIGDDWFLGSCTGNCDIAAPTGATLFEMGKNIRFELVAYSWSSVSISTP